MHLVVVINILSAKALSFTNCTQPLWFGCHLFWNTSRGWSSKNHWSSSLMKRISSLSASSFLKIEQVVLIRSEGVNFVDPQDLPESVLAQLRNVQHALRNIRKSRNEWSCPKFSWSGACKAVVTELGTGSLGFLSLNEKTASVVERAYSLNRVWPLK